jgi:hypothetical protein
MNIFIGLAFYSHEKNIISTRGEIWAHKTSLTRSLIIVPIQQSEQSCNLCVKDIDCSFSYEFIMFFQTCHFREIFIAL